MPPWYNLHISLSPHGRLRHQKGFKCVALDKCFDEKEPGMNFMSSAGFVKLAYNDTYLDLWEQHYIISYMYSLYWPMAKDMCEYSTQRGGECRQHDGPRLLQLGYSLQRYIRSHLFQLPGICTIWFCGRWKQNDKPVSELQKNILYFIWFSWAIPSKVQSMTNSIHS